MAEHDVPESAIQQLDAKYTRELESISATLSELKQAMAAINPAGQQNTETAGTSRENTSLPARRARESSCSESQSETSDSDELSENTERESDKKERQKKRAESVSGQKENHSQQEHTKSVKADQNNVQHKRKRVDSNTESDGYDSNQGDRCKPTKHAKTKKTKTKNQRARTTPRA